MTSTSDGQLPRYKPIVVDRYPLEDKHDHPLEPGTADFALPLDDRPVGVNDDRERAVYTFVLTNSARELTFGTTCRSSHFHCCWSFSLFCCLQLLHKQDRRQKKLKVVNVPVQN